MNEIVKIIKERRSIRKYLPEQIKDEELNLILEAATYAPSGHNDQPWHFTVIQNKDLLNDLNVKSKELMSKANTDWIAKMGQNERYHVFHNAPTVIIVSGEENPNTDWIAKMGQNERYHVFHNAPTVIIVSGQENPNKELDYCPMGDVSAAIQNMLLTAQSIGVASCWVGLTNFVFEIEEEVKKLNLPQGFKPLFTVTLGYSAITKEINALPRRENVISYIK